MQDWSPQPLLFTAPLPDPFQSFDHGKSTKKLFSLVIMSNRARVSPEARETHMCGMT